MVAVRGILLPSKGGFLRALFSNLYMRTLAPGRRQKAAKVRPDLRMKDALLIKLCRAAAVERECWGGGIELQHRHTRRQTYALSDVYTERHSTQCNTQRIIMAPSEG